MTPGLVYLVGAGPGDPELITVRGARCLEQADVLIYDRLVNPALLNLARPEAERIDVGKAAGKPSTASLKKGYLNRKDAKNAKTNKEDPLRSLRLRGETPVFAVESSVAQEAINQLLVDRARAGQVVVRLKGGDPFVFGRGGEEALALAAAGIPFEVVPGVTAAVAVPAVVGIPLTHRGVSRSFAVVTGHTRDGGLPDLPLADTLVVLMGVNPLNKIVAALLAQGWSAATPAAIIAEGTTPRQRVVTGTLADIADRANGLEPPAVLVVGNVVRLRADLTGLRVP